MAITLETRAIHLSSEVPDLYVTTTHLPDSQTLYREEDRLAGLVTSMLNVPAWTALGRFELRTFWDSLPEHLRTDFPEVNPEWLSDDGLFLKRVLQVQLEGEVLAPLLTDRHSGSDDPFGRLVAYFLNARRYGHGIVGLEQVGLRQASLYAWALTRLHGVYAGGLQTKDICIKNGIMISEVNHETSGIGGPFGGQATSCLGTCG